MMLPPWIDTAIVGLFFLVTLCIGIFDRKKISIDDYWVNGRRTGKLVLIATIFSSFIGSGSMLGGAGFAFEGGGFATIVLGASYFFYLLLFARFLAPRIKEFGDERGAYTLPDFLGARFGEATRLAGIGIILFSWGLFAASQILAMGAFASLLTGISPVFATTVGALFVISYAVVGGLRADIRTDVFQACVMLILLIVFVPFVFINAGGLPSILALPDSFLSGSTVISFPILLLAFFTFGAGIFTSPDIWQRVYAGNSASTVKWSLSIAAVLMFFFFLMATLFGIFGKILFPELESHMIIPALLQSTLPPGVLGLVLAGFFAAILSTADTVLIIMSMTVVHDIIQRTVHTQPISTKDTLRLSRLMTLVFGLIGLLLAWTIPSIVQLTIYAVSLYSALLPAIVIGLLTKTTAPHAAFWSVILSTIAVVATFFVYPLYAFIPGMFIGVLSFGAFYLLERLIRSRSSAMVISS